MRPLKENSPHDLYLRASSATKPMAPLKLYANITGKFTVERDLVKIQDKIRSTTLDAEKSRKERGITMLDGPPSNVSSAQNGKKRKAPVANSTLFRKPIPQPRPSTSTAAPPSSPVRAAIVKALALKDRSLDDLLSLMPAENDADKRKRKLLELLTQVRFFP
jgi:RNA polymerase II elongation factor ELL